MKNFNTVAKTLALSAALLITACSTGSDSDTNQDKGASADNTTTVTASSLNQAAFVSSTSTYRYGHNSIPNIALTDAPADTDYTRWAMLHDGSVYRLYFFKKDTNNTLYQFGYNAATQSYEYGFQSIPELTLTGIPGDADTSSFSMLHDGSSYRLYMRSQSNVNTMYQFAYNAATQNYEFGFNSIDTLFITLAPADVDHSRWGMLHDGSVYRLYIGKAGSPDSMYQFAYNAASSDYEWGYLSIPELTVTDMPTDSIKTDFAMLHDGSNYRFYYQSEL